MIASHAHYIWFVAVVTFVSAASWIAVDAYRLRGALRGDRSDLAVKDRIFGSMIGILIGAIGVGGVLHYVITRDMI